MTNPKGTKGETDVVRWLHLNGFGGAERKVKYGSRDQGDVNVCPGIVAECKNYRHSYP